MQRVSWKKFIENTKGKPPRPLLKRAVKRVGQKKCALDLGAGALNDSKYLLAQKFKRVVAVDFDPEALKQAKKIRSKKFVFFQCRYEKFPFKKEGPYDLINASLTLGFNPPKVFNQVFPRICTSLAPGGIFVGQLFGNRHGWNTPGKEMTFHSERAARALFRNMEVLTFTETEEEKKSSVLHVMTNFHFFHFIVRK